MHLQCEAGRPVAVATIRPWLKTPTRIHEGDRLWYLVGTEHLSKHIHDLQFGDLIGLRFDLVGLVLYNRDEQDPRAFEETWAVERLEERVVASPNRIGVQKVLCGSLPENLSGRELEEDLGVCGHGHALDAGALPLWKLGMELDSFGLEHADRKSDDCIVSIDAHAISGVDRDAMFGVRDVSDDGIE